ncbi:dihydrofolate reductase family protein [Candidatus Uhrbacteria bacterium]|nr:dihydrofolate reductase family protein [Candidatus Uhrbacteria bacterium]
MKKNNTTIRAPRFIAFVASSVDGRISLTKKTLPDWTSREDWQFFQKALKKMDAVVVGRNTYKAARTRLRKRTTYVFSRHLKRVTRRGSVTFINPARVNLTDMFQSYRTVGILGGASVYQTMLEKGMLDELSVTIEPLLFGHGVPMFSGGKSTKMLALRSGRKLNNKGTLLLHYIIL